MRSKSKPGGLVDESKVILKMLPMKCKETVCRYIFVGTPETPIVSASSPFSIFRPMASPILEWNTHREAPESIIASNFLQGGECFAGLEIWTHTAAAQSSTPLRLG